MYLRSFEKGKNKYYYIAKAVRIKDKVIQKSILYLGTADRIYKKLKSQKMNSDAMPIAKSCMKTKSILYQFYSLS